MCTHAQLNIAVAHGVDSWEQFTGQTGLPTSASLVSIQERIYQAEGHRYSGDEFHLYEQSSNHQSPSTAARAALSISEIQPMAFQEITANETRDVANHRDARFVIQGERQETFRVLVSDATGSQQPNRVTMYSAGARHSFQINLQVPTVDSLAGNGRRRISISGNIPVSAFPIRGGSYTGTYRVLVEYDD